MKKHIRYGKTIRDAKKSLVIYVKPADIEGAVCRDHQKCVIARAIMRQRSSRAKWVDVGSQVVLIGTSETTGMRYRLDNQSRRAVRFFDENDGRFAPCSIELATFKPSRKLGLRVGEPTGGIKNKVPRTRKKSTR